MTATNKFFEVLSVMNLTIPQKIELLNAAKGMVDEAMEETFAVVYHKPVETEPESHLPIPPQKELDDIYGHLHPAFSGIVKSIFPDSKNAA